MRKEITIKIAAFMVLVVGALLSFGSLVAYAKSPPNKPGKGDVASLDLYEMDVLGKVVWDGAQGKLKYNLAGPKFEFIFSASRLDPNAIYNLIWSREPDIALPKRFEIIATQTSDAYGNLSISGSHKFNIDLIAAKILLIPADISADGPGKFMFGHGSVSYDDKNTDLKCGERLSPGPAGWDELGLQVGDKAIDFNLGGLDPTMDFDTRNPIPGALSPGNQPQTLKQFRLLELLAEKPVVLITGSFT